VGEEGKEVAVESQKRDFGLVRVLILQKKKQKKTSTRKKGDLKIPYIREEWMWEVS